MRQRGWFTQGHSAGTCVWFWSRRSTTLAHHSSWNLEHLDDSSSQQQNQGTKGLSAIFRVRTSEYPRASVRPDTHSCNLSPRHLIWFSRRYFCFTRASEDWNLYEETLTSVIVSFKITRILYFMAFICSSINYILPIQKGLPHFLFPNSDPLPPC